MSFNLKILDLDAKAETERIVQTLRDSVLKTMHKRGAVVGISGGVDSSLTLGLCALAFGAEHVTALLLPDKDSDSRSADFANQAARRFGVAPISEEITPGLEGLGCYSRRDTAIRRVFPEFDADRGYKAKITLPSNLLTKETLNVFSLTVITPSGEVKVQRLAPEEFLQIEAASNFKQRTRMAMLYYYAESRNYAVVGTANRDEHEQGFFVKYGDGGVDIFPIAHLYKTQVYQLARHIGVPNEIIQRTPTTDTYSAQQTQEEFFFRLPFSTLDLLSYAQEHAVPLDEVSAALGLTAEQINRIYADLAHKKRATTYLRLAPITLEP